MVQMRVALLRFKVPELVLFMLWSVHILLTPGCRSNARRATNQYADPGVLRAPAAVNAVQADAGGMAHADGVFEVDMFLKGEQNTQGRLLFLPSRQDLFLGRSLL